MQALQGYLESMEFMISFIAGGADLTCYALCSNVTSIPDEVICNVLCDLVGYELFTELLKRYGRIFSNVVLILETQYFYVKHLLLVLYGKVGKWKFEDMI